jgi:integrase
MDGGISARAINKLSDKKIQSFISKMKVGKAAVTKLSDGAGMYLTVTPAGTPVWRLKYRLGGKERLYAIGVYPSINLNAARTERDRIRAQVRQGHDPVKGRQLERATAASSSANTFEMIAADWLSNQDWSDIHREKSSRALERDVFPRLGGLPVKDITPAMIAGVIEAVVKRGAVDTAGKILQHVAGVFRFAQARGLRMDNPAEPVHEVLPTKKNAGRMPALLTFPALGALLRSAEAAHLSPSVRTAHRLCAFTVARISNIVEAEWAEFDLDADVPVWVIPRQKMKSQNRHHDHKIVLCPVIAEELRGWQRTVGRDGFVFRSPAGGKHITRESVEKAYRVTLRLEGQHSPHGWRAAFSTLARDHGFDRDVVELTLDHIHDNDVVRAYDRGERLQQRIALMTWWGEQLRKAQHGADIVPLTSATTVS